MGIIRFDGGDGEVSNVLEVYVDSEWAGCKRTRVSTSGGLAVWGSGFLKSWSSSQGSVALSSGEAEFYAAVKGAAEGLGIQALLADLGWNVEVKLLQDSTAAKGTASRIGLGRIKHMDVRYCWIQDCVRKKRITCKYIAGSENPADILTKPQSVDEANRRLRDLGYTVVVSRKTNSTSFAAAF